MKPSKGNKVSVSTFETYETDNVIGFKRIEVGSKKKVKFAW